MDPPSDADVDGEDARFEFALDDGACYAADGDASEDLEASFERAAKLVASRQAFTTDEADCFVATTTRRSAPPTCSRSSTDWSATTRPC
ncbi:hypothetical protein VTK73DRAFT_4741 [Phialemonium thermophilum]|uniref:Uncharacterized protein n=1 Tax=Phialemonium thermophilum TaxID=223376 RepID=A0ABR3V6P4_9PEZI